MVEVVQGGERVCDDRVGTPAMDVRDEGHAAGVVLVGPVVEALQAAVGASSGIDCNNSGRLGRVTAQVGTTSARRRRVYLSVTRSTPAPIADPTANTTATVTAPRPAGGSLRGAADVG